MKAPLYDLNNKPVSEIEVSDEIFGRPWNADLVHQALMAHVANRRRPLAHTKGHSEVSGGGRKPWRQKGTGRARQGSIRSPLWKGGGVSHGPTKEKKYGKKINKKMLRIALHAALSRKLKDNNLKFVESLELKAPKTKELVMLLKPFGTPSTLIVSETHRAILSRASANLKKVKSLNPQSLNIEDILTHKDILIARDAVPAIK